MVLENMENIIILKKNVLKPKLLKHVNLNPTK